MSNPFQPSPEDSEPTPFQPAPVRVPPPGAANGAPVASSVRCLKCGYDLTGVAIGSLCPECGAAVVPAFQSTSMPVSGKAVASLVLGIVSIPLCVCLGVPSLICGALALYFAKVARDDIAAGMFSEQSRGMATAGMICGLIGLGLSILHLGYFVTAIVMRS